MADAFSIASSVILFVSFVSYFFQVASGDSTPNPASWSIWVLITFINAVTYFTVVGGDVAKALITFVSAFGVTSIFIYSVFRGKLRPMNDVDKFCFSSAIATGVFWQASGNAVASNIMLQAIILISFFPTIYALIMRKGKERALPWLIGAVAYILLVAAIIMDWKDGSIFALVHPVVDGIICNVSVSIVIIMCNRRKAVSLLTE